MVGGNAGKETGFVADSVICLAFCSTQKVSTDTVTLFPDYTVPALLSDSQHGAHSSVALTIR